MSQDQKSYIPSWLRRMRGWEETPDWLLQKIQEEEGGFSFLDLGMTPESAGFGGDEVRARDRDDEPPQWEKRDEPAQREKGGGSLTEIAEELREAYERERRGPPESPTEQAGKTEAASTDQDEEASPSTRKSSGVTDWLVDLEEETPSEDAPPSEMRESSNWAAETATMGTEDLPEPDVEEEEADAPGGRTGVTDWLTHLEEEPIEPAPPTTGPERAASATPAEQTDMPDWLADLETTAPASSGGEPEWIPDLEDEAEDEDLFADQEEDTPAWLVGPQGEGEGEDIPAWLTELDSGGGITAWLAEQDEAAAPPSAIDEEEASPPPAGIGPTSEAGQAPDVPQVEEETGDLEIDAEDEDTPDWLRDLDQMTKEQPSAPEHVADTVQEDKEASWEADDLAVSIEDEDAPDWLRALDQGVKEQPPAPDQVADTVQEDKEASWEADDLAVSIEDEDATDWLRALDQGVEEQPPAPDQVTGAPPQGQALARDADRTESEVEEGIQEDQVPDWLRGFEETAEEQPAALDQEPDTEPRPDSDQDADDLQAEAGEGDAPDWLHDLDEIVDEQPATAVPTSDAARLDAELAPDAGQREDDLKEDAGDDQVPDWLRDLAAGESEPAAELLTEMDASVPDAQLVHGADEHEEGTELEDVGSEAVPDWLRDLAIGEDEPEVGPLSEADANAPDWLSFPEEPPTLRIEKEEAEPRSEPEQGPPAWMQGIYTQQETPADTEALSLPSDEELDDEETPDWLSSLRGKGTQSARQESTVETSGPLAGLGNVLSPEPILAIHPKSTFQPIPPVPDAHQAEAELVIRTLETPTSRRIRVSRSAGREILDSLGRWVIYGLLIATILIAPLRSLVQLPDLAETHAFYNAIEGLQPGENVLLVFDYDASLDGTLTPQARAIMWHLQRKGLGIVILSLTPQGAAMAKDLVAEREGLVAGRDYIDLGYLPPHPASLLAFMENPVGGVTSMGTTENPGQTALGRQIEAFSSLDMVVAVSGDHEHIRWWIEQVQTKTPIAMIAAVPAGIVPYMTPYYGEMGTGQVAGILGGLAPAAQYEELIGADFLPSARVSYVVQTNVLILFIGVVLVSGLGSLLAARQRRSAAKRPVPSTSGGN